MNIMKKKTRLFIVISEKVGTVFEVKVIQNLHPFGHHESVLNLPSVTGV